MVRSAKGGLVLCALLLFSACATLGPPEPPSLDLPKPPADLRATRKGNQVTLTWTIPTVTTDRQNIHSVGPTRICRAAQPAFTECGKPVGQAAPSTTSNPSSGKKKKHSTQNEGKKKEKPAESYTDTLPGESDNPSEFITYAVEVLNADGRGAGISNQVRVSSLRTLPPPTTFAAQVTSQGVVVSWNSNIPSSGPQNVRYVYRVYRRLAEGQQETLVGELPGGDEPKLSLTDSNIEWQKTYEYRVEAVTVIEQKDKPELQIEGENSPAINVFANDTFPPAVPTGLQAAFSGPGQERFVDLVWAPDTEADLAGYNVYRREEGTSAAKQNAEPLKTPSYRDRDVNSGKTYIYSVSAVDLRGNESARSEEASEPVP
jgi:hypothetical protein